MTVGSHVTVSAASDPANICPSLGPPVTTTVKTPWIRPRIASGTAACRIVVRKIARDVVGAARDREAQRTRRRVRARGHRRNRSSTRRARSS